MRSTVLMLVAGGLFSAASWGAPLALTCAANMATDGMAYSSALVATGGVPPYTFSITSGSLPLGLTLNTSTGAITGIPDAPDGRYGYSPEVTDSTGGTLTDVCAIYVSVPALTLACASSTGQVGMPYSSALVATGGVPPYTFSITSGSLPPGLTLNTSTGAITGTPTMAGTFNFTAQVVDSSGTPAGTVTTNCSIDPTGAPPPPPTSVCGFPTFAALTPVGPGADVPYQVRYATNLSYGDSAVIISNTGASSTSVNPVTGSLNGNLCANVYTLSPDEQLISCCSCPVTPDALASLSVDADLISNTLTGVKPNSVVIKLVASLEVATNPISDGLAAWGTTVHGLGPTVVLPSGGSAPPLGTTLGLTETPFTSSTMSAAELTRLNTLCGFIQGNGSGYGICNSCRLGALGAAATN
jgi:hypothetical protein